MEDVPQVLTTASGVRCGFRTVRSAGESATTSLVHLRLVARVGSLLETGDQTGAAHFIEHLGFRGTEMFDHGQLITRVESFGSSFGPDLNARTSLCETIWQLDLPLSRMEEGLEVLREWAFGIRIATDDVEAERKVILEEWRQKQCASQRTKRKFWSLAAPLVGDRMPIGTKEFISNVTNDQLREFYESTYNTNNLAVVCVVEQPAKSTQEDSWRRFTQAMEHIFRPEKCRYPSMSAKITPNFPVSLQAMRNRPQGSRSNVEVACVVDPDLITNAISIEFLSDRVSPSPTDEFLKREILKRVLTSALDERFRERRLEGSLLRSPSISFGVAVQSPYVEMSGVRVELPTNATLEHCRDSIVSLVRELCVAVLHGFTPEEISHAKAKWRRHFAERKQTSTGACEEMVEYFSLGERTLLLSFQEEKDRVLQLLREDSQGGVSTQEVDAFCHDWLEPLTSLAVASSSSSSSTKREDVLLCLFQGPVVPAGLTEASMRLVLESAVKSEQCEEGGRQHRGKRHHHHASSIFDADILRSVLHEDVEMLVNSHSNTTTPRKTLNSMTEESEMMERSKAEYKSFSLNGRTLRMCIKRTENKQISVQAFAIGGATELDDPREDAALCLLGDALRESGLGRLSGMELSRLESLSGARVFLQRHLHHRGIGGSCSNRDQLTVLLEMILLRTQDFRCEASVLERLKAREVDSIIAMGVSSHGDETVALRDLTFGTAEPLLRPHVEEDVQTLDATKLVEVAKRGFQRLDEFTFCLIGNLSPDKDDDLLREFAQRALELASTEEATSQWLRHNDHTIRPMDLRFTSTPGSTRKVVYASKTVTDKSQIYLVLKPADCLTSSEAPLKDFILGAVSEAIRSRLIARLRTNRGEVYSIQTDHSRTPLSPQARMFLSFSCDGNKDDMLAERAQQELHETAIWGFSDEESEAALSIVKQRLGRSTATDSHVLFRLLEGLKSTGSSLEETDLIASQHFVDSIVSNPDRFKVELKSILREMILGGTACLIVRYRPQEKL